MEGITDRFLALVDALRQNGEVKDYKDFTRTVGASSSALTEISKGRTKVGLLLIQKTVSKFPNVDLDWLVTGKGEMFKTKSELIAPNVDRQKKGGLKGEIPKVKQSPPFVGNPTVERLREEILRLDIGRMERIPIVEISAAAGHGAINPDFINETDLIQLPTKMIKKGLHHCIRIKGQSMAPTLQDGTYLIIRLLEPNEWTRIPDGKIHVVVTRDGETYVKRVNNRLQQEGYIQCTSDNFDKAYYPDFDVDETELHNIWEAEWYLSNKLPPTNDRQTLEVESLKEQMKRITDSLSEKGLLKPV